MPPRRSRPQRDTMHDPMITENYATSMASRDIHDKVVEEVLRKARLKDSKMLSAVVDAKLMTYFDQRYLEGMGVGTESLLVPALPFRAASLGHKEAQELARATRVALHLHLQEPRLQVKTGKFDKHFITSRRWLSDAVATWRRQRPRGPAPRVERVQLRAASCRALVKKVVNSMSQTNLAEHDQVGNRLPAALADLCAATLWHKEAGGVERDSSSKCFPGLEASGKN